MATDDRLSTSSDSFNELETIEKARRFFRSSTEIRFHELDASSCVEGENFDCHGQMEVTGERVSAAFFNVFWECRRCGHKGLVRSNPI